MKKFGTPIGAGPGSANENVGFDAEGTPPLPFGVFGVFGFDGFDGLLEAGFLCFDECDPFFLGAGVALCVEGFCFLPEPLGCGGFADGVVVEVVFGDVVVVVVVVLELDVDVELEVVLGVVVVVVVDEHDSVTELTGPVTGSLIEDSGVPGGTLTVKLNFCPFSIVTVTTHVSAEAVGSVAMPLTASAVTTATTSFRLLNIVARLLPRSGVRTFRNRDLFAARAGRY